MYSNKITLPLEGQGKYLNSLNFSPSYLPKISKTYEEFGLNLTTLPTGAGGYSSSETWVLDANENPENNLTGGNSFIAGAFDRIVSLHIATYVGADDVLNGVTPIAQIGIYANDINKTLVYTIEFRGDNTREGTFWNEIEVDVPLTEGVEYFIGSAFNGQNSWPEQNPDLGGSTVYKNTTSQVAEDLGLLVNRSSSWMVPLYARVERKTT